MLLALGRDRHVDHHDPVLLDDADEEDHADHRDEAEIESEQHESGDRARPCRRQGRQYRQRVDIALIENAEDQIDDEQSCQDEQGYGAQRGLKSLGVALESADQRCRHLHLALGALNCFGGAAEGSALLQVEADGHGGKLALVADR